MEICFNCFIIKLIYLLDTSVSLEGALGKIALNSVRNPRQLLQVSSKHNDVHHHAGPSSGNHQQHQKIPSISSHGIIDHRKVLRSIENVYTAVLALEELRRNQPPLPRSYSDHEREAFEKWYVYFFCVIYDL
jgi:DNA topoisomerase 2-associated protein PAT1